MLMNAPEYQVVPESANPLGYLLIHPEKGIRWHITKVFRDQDRTAYHYRFAPLNAHGKAVSEAAYPAFARSKGLTLAANEHAAAWFLTRYFSFRELHYHFPLAGCPSRGGYYPVLGRYDAAKNLQPIQKPLMQKQDFELSWE